MYTLHLYSQIQNPLHKEASDPMPPPLPLINSPTQNIQSGHSSHLITYKHTEWSCGD